MSLPPALQAGYYRLVQTLRATPGEVAFAAAWEAGWAMSLEAAVALALCGYIAQVDLTVE
jgi:hypothetical protein